MIRIADNSLPLPLLVTGIAGVAGYNAFHYLREKFPGEVFGIRREDHWPLRGEGIVGCDIENRDSLNRLLDEHQIAAVLNCGGSCALKSCEMDPKMARRVNVEGVENLVAQLAGTETRLVHLSIDLVYSGTRGGGHVEGDWTDPVTIYGKTMVEAENVILERRKEACILRISLPMGISFNGHAGAIDWIQSRFKQLKPATLYFDEIRTPTYTDCLNRVLEEALSRRKMHGLFHAGGPRRLSLYEIAQVVNRVGGYRPEDLMGCFRFEAGPVPPRAGNVSLDSNKLAQTLGFEPFDPWPLHDDFVPTHRDWHKERNGVFQGSPKLLSEVLYQNPGLSDDVG